MKTVEAFDYQGYHCELGIYFAYVGYVDIPPGHPWHGKHYRELNKTVHIHGGLTYSNVEEERWRIGFDCGHPGDTTADAASERADIFDQMLVDFGDMAGAMIGEGVMTGSAWTKEMVIAEVKRLADQVALVEME